MEQWQFLIQKQGDRSWHDLKSPNLEISEGRYRVLARSPLRNTDVEIRITHSSAQEIPPKRRIQKRSRRTNAEGLMAVIPFTHLKPGIWELQCSGDLMSDLLGKSWQYGIHLEVLSPESSRVRGQSPTGENVASNLPPSPDSTSDRNLKSPIASEPQPTVKNEPILTDLPTQTATDGTVIEELVSPVWLEGDTAEQLLENLISLALPMSETLVEDGKVEEHSDPKPPPPLSLTLDREIHIAHWGEIAVIHGRVEEKEQTNQKSESTNPETFYALELVIEMRSPLGSEILTQVRQPLPNSSLPMTISSAINIPVDCKSKLILADINLYGAFTEFGEVVLLASKTFTITADVTELLAITDATRFHEQNLLEPPAEPEPSISIDLGLFNLAKTAKTNQPQFIQTSLNKSLPPQFNLEELEITSLRVSELNKLAYSRLPQLPRLPENQIIAKAVLTEGLASADVDIESSGNESLVEKTETIAPINLAQLVISHHRVRMLNSTFPYLKRLKALPEKTEALNNDIPDALSLVAAEDDPQMDTDVAEDENIPELVLIHPESQDEPVAEISLPANLELSAEANLNASPLLRKWTQSQGYSLPKSIIEVLDQQKILAQQVPVSTDTEEINSSSHLESETVIEADQIPLLPNAIETESPAIAVEIEEMKTLEQVEAENISVEISVTSSDSQLPPVDDLAAPSPWLTQEFVVEDITEAAVDVTYNHSSEQNQQPTSDLSPVIEGRIVELLPIPQLHVPDGELIAGTSVRVRVELPTVSPQIVVKLWMEDCQTRGLLDSPHLLKDLLPNHLGSLEVVTQLNIPFGCLEISIEAIAFNQATQQESHKVTVVRTVIPPDLPNFQLDELLGI
ncbi:hypothetical protein [Nodularia sp. NIES-3585]|uniref:hypothetical protein n=1 Tax=Nodularia sp. NIES-3585 TaxID=1973477 RepID=UPI000B5C6FC2|nr:hypothetical protein [Nodularia sp. NIES-3585]